MICPINRLKNGDTIFFIFYIKKQKLDKDDISDITDANHKYKRAYPFNLGNLWSFLIKNLLV